MDLFSIAVRSQSIQLLGILRERLIKQKLWIPPKIFFWEYPKLSKIKDEKEISNTLVDGIPLSTVKREIIRMKGSIVSTWEEATHLVIDKTLIDQEDTEDYNKPVRQADNKVLMHWWYYPDSWDVWLDPVDDAGEILSDEEEAPDPWLVSTEWITKAINFNEWMTESDFELLPEMYPKDLIDKLGIELESPTSSNKEEVGVKEIEEKEDESNKILPPKIIASKFPEKTKRKKSTEQAKKVDADKTLDEMEKEAVPKPSVIPDKQFKSNKKLRTEESHLLTEDTSLKIPEKPIRRSRGEETQIQTPNETPVQRPVLRSARKTPEESFQSTLNPIQSQTPTSLTVSFPRKGKMDETPVSTAMAIGEPQSKKPKIDESDAEILAGEPQSKKPTIDESDAEMLAGELPLETPPRQLRSDVSKKKESSPRKSLSDEDTEMQEPIDVGGPVLEIQANNLEETVNPENISRKDFPDMDEFGGSQEIKKGRPRQDELMMVCEPSKYQPETALIVNERQYEEWEEAGMLLELGDLEEAKDEDWALVSGYLRTIEEDEEDMSDSDLKQLAAAEGNLRTNFSSFIQPPVKSEQLDQATYSSRLQESEVTVPFTEPPSEEITEQIAEKMATHKSTICSWFDPEKIHPLEKSQLSVIFESMRISNQDPRDVEAANNTESIEVRYMEVRNSLIKFYERNPSTFLTMAKCRRTYAGDSSLLLRIYSFLCKWGLINYLCDPGTAPSGSSYRLQDFALSSNKYPATKGVSEESGSGVHKSTKKCLSCQKICLYCFYTIKPDNLPNHYSFLEQCAWCPKCYEQNQIPSIINTSHLQKTHVPIAFSSMHSDLATKWKTNQALKLLEAVEMFSENWDQVAAHVGDGKTPRECLEFFVQLPVEETVIATMKPTSSESLLGEGNKVFHLGNKKIDVLREVMLGPNDDQAPNRESIMAFLALCTSSLQPEDVGKATAAALDVLRSNVNHPRKSESEMVPYRVAGAVALAACQDRAAELAKTKEERIVTLLREFVDSKLQELKSRVQELSKITSASI
eukprot:GHVP01057989.1.p1 GENE.GHVP01057989.1~~GHVP01057989.1.p1  ORF type:complete len:1176 (-),score=265.14 GHVP01057989.1:5926-9024(-)